MLNDVTEMGTTLHRTSARIDCGAADGQQTFPRDPDDSHMLLLAKAAAAGAQLLARHVHALSRGETPVGTPIDPKAARYPYRSWPERDELRQFRAMGLAYWRASDCRRVLRFDDVLAPDALVPATSQA